MSNKSIEWDATVDVVVVGAGVAGLCAAIAAHDGGAKTLLLEASSLIGGTASWSGGAAWIPLNPYLQEAGGADSREAALGYMRACAEGLADEKVYTAYLDAAAEAVGYLERSTPLRLEMGTMPDYQGSIPGGVYKEGISRSVAPDVFNLNDLGAHQPQFRRSPFGTVPFSFSEFQRFDAVLHPEKIDRALYAERLKQGVVGWGEALTASLYAGVLQRDIDVRVNARARHVVVDGGVKGVSIETDGKEIRIQARRGVILCNGGFEWDAKLMEQHFPGVRMVPSTVPTNRGDGWRMAEEAGAAMDNLNSCWGWPSYLVPGELQSDGNPLVRTGLVERNLPHLIIVNGRGERFVDETLPYHRILKSMLQRDAQGRFVNLPAFHLFDQQYREKYSFGPVTVHDATPAWMKSYSTLDALAEASGMQAETLRRTVIRFNEDVRSGADRQFNRGTAAYGRFWGDVANEPGPNLGTVEKPPFHVVEMIPSTIGTCSGSKIDGLGRVVDAIGKAIPGLFAAGNVTAAISGPAYFGPGGTIGPAMVFGVLAGRTAAGGADDGQSYDVIVVGGGGAGMAAAIQAADLGAKVALLEANKKLGGSTALAGGIFYAAGTPVQKEAGIKDDADTMYSDVKAINGDTVASDVLRRLCADAPGTFRWLQDLGVEFPQSKLASPNGRTIPRSHEPEGFGAKIVEQLDYALSQRPVDVACNTRVQELATDSNGAVIGVKVDGELIRAGAVVIATGGYGGNQGLIDRMLPKTRNLGDWVWHVGCRTNQGDGLKMAEAVGAKIAGEDSALLLMTPNFYKELEVIGPDWVMMVNTRGERFIREDSAYWEISEGLEAQEGARGFCILDQELLENAKPHPRVLEALAAGTITLSWVPRVLKEQAANGGLIRGATVEELAGKIGVDPDRLRRSLDRYNAAVHAGVDRDFDKAAQSLKPIESAPYYAAEVRPAVLIVTGGGVTIDADAHVLNTQHKPIAGLFAAGETTGNVYGRYYVGSGYAIASSLTFGCVAGREAAAYAKATANSSALTGPVGP